MAHSKGVSMINLLMILANLIAILFLHYNLAVSTLESSSIALNLLAVMLNVMSVGVNAYVLGRAHDH